MMRSKKLFGVLLAGILLTGCGNGTPNKPAQAEVVPGLRLQRVQSQNVPEEIEAPGSVIAVSTAQVAARTMGTVLNVAVKEGDTVRRGQLLAQLDERELAAHRGAAQAASQAASAGVVQANKGVAAAQAQAEVAQKTYDRYAYLRDQKSVSPQEFDEVAAKNESVKAVLEQAKAMLRQAQASATQAQSEAQAAESMASYARVVAPFDGRVIRRSVEPGSLVSPGTLLFVVEDAGRYQLEVTLPTEALATVKRGSRARVQLDELAEKPLEGKVAEIEAGADATSHTVKARVDLPHEDGMQSGVFGRGFFARGEKRALLVAKEAVVMRGQLNGVFVAEAEGLLHWRVVTLGQATNGQVELQSGVNDGDVVVMNPGTQELDGKKAAL